MARPGPKHDGRGRTDLGKLGLLGGANAADHFRAVLDILKPLDAENRLTAEQKGWIAATENNLAQALKEADKPD